MNRSIRMGMLVALITCNSVYGANCRKAMKGDSREDMMAMIGSSVSVGMGSLIATGPNGSPEGRLNRFVSDFSVRFAEANGIAVEAGVQLWTASSNAKPIVHGVGVSKIGSDADVGEAGSRGLCVSTTLKAGYSYGIDYNGSSKSNGKTNPNAASNKATDFCIIPSADLTFCVMDIRNKARILDRVAANAEDTRIPGVFLVQGLAGASIDFSIRTVSLAFSVIMGMKFNAWTKAGSMACFSTKADGDSVIETNSPSVIEKFAIRPIVNVKFSGGYTKENKTMGVFFGFTHHGLSSSGGTGTSSADASKAVPGLLLADMGLTLGYTIR